VSIGDDLWTIYVVGDGGANRQLDASTRQCGYASTKEKKTGSRLIDQLCFLLPPTRLFEGE
jgi:hypothetical protein